MPPASDDDHRRPGRAALLSFFIPGLGQLYAGRPWRGALVWLGVVAGAAAATAIVFLLPSDWSVLALAIMIAVPLFAVIDAARQALWAPVPYRLRWYNHWATYLAVVMAMGFGVTPLLQAGIHSVVGEAFRVASPSMAPALLEGDYVVVSPLRHDPARGDLVALRTPHGRYVKRVVGLPGDTIAMAGGTLRVDGREIAEPYAHHGEDWTETGTWDWQRRALAPGIDAAGYEPSGLTWGPFVVPPRAYFVLGDDRGRSYDGRYFGFTPRDSILGAPSMIYFSMDPETNEVRWDRIHRFPAR